MKQLSKQDLENKLLELRKEFFSLRGQTSSGAPIKSPGLIKTTRRNIARIHTFLKLKKEETNK
ncbi:50S ribosomal protein L29 [Candidatus Woesearchaeota archaeon]|nr:50S ribosomal protein L29 [Candidatus Woesearchaeota archaeon]